jgi:hypothetical protein
VYRRASGRNHQLHPALTHLAAARPARQAPSAAAARASILAAAAQRWQSDRRRTGLSWPLLCLRLPDRRRYLTSGRRA